jgi:DNA mismatch repair protein MutL
MHDARIRRRVPRIRILPEVVSNKIAAGEVVERPASAVKELMENALDAGSPRILVEVEKGGRRFIRVSDTGSGMGRDDALLALERYATSKIEGDQDLFAIRSLGFRGEALPSIAAVSRLTLVTNEDPKEPGTEIRIEGGKIVKVNAIGAPQGTQVTVKDLFFNTPARRKFLKSVSTEMGHIVDTVDRIALGWPGTVFELVSNGRTIRRFSAESHEVHRVMEVLGVAQAGDLKEIRFSAEGLTLRGWTVPPQETRTTGRGIFIYVNGRFVRDRILRHALMEGFRGRLVKGTFPLAVLKITLPEDQVDVNVHPTKSEVRFLRGQWVHDQVAAAVAKALEASMPFAWRPRSNFGTKPLEVRETHALFTSPPMQGGSAMPREAPAVPKEQAHLWEDTGKKPLQVIGQFRSTYIVCESDEGLLLIDQHAAHERIFFEQMQKAGGALAQRLLVPETVELGFRESRILEKWVPALNTLGVEIESFGETTFVIKSVPALLGGRPVEPLIRELIEKAAEIGVAGSFKEPVEHCLAVIACHAAVRGGQALSKEAMEDIIEKLYACRHPANCPHGRPTFIQWTDAFLEKAFFRTP